MFSRLKSTIFSHFFLLALFGSLFVPQAHAQMVADDVLGQAGAFTTGLVNGKTQINGYGFTTPTKMVLDSVNHRLFVGDTDRVLIWNLPNDNTIDTTGEADYVLGFSNFTNNSNFSSASASNFSGVTDLVLDTTNDAERLFVSDRSRNRVLVFNVSGTITNNMAASNVLGQTLFTTGTAAVTQSSVRVPNSLAFDQARQLLFVSQGQSGIVHRVSVFDVTSITNGENAVNVLGQSTYTGTTPATTQAGLSSPQGLYFEPTEKFLYVADQGNNRVVVYDLSGSISNGMAASYLFGQANFTSATSGTTATTLSSPGNVLVDDADDLVYVGDTSNRRILVYNVASAMPTSSPTAVNVLGQADFTTATTQTTSASSLYAGKMNFLNSDQLAVSDLYRVKLYDVAAITDNESATGILGQVDADGTVHFDTNITDSLVPTAKTLYYPRGVELDTVNHRLFVGDRYNYRVLVFNLDSSNQLLDATADYVLGTDQMYKVSDGVHSSTVFYPMDIAYDSTNNYLFVTDSDRVLVFDVASITNGEAAVKVLGQANFTSTVTGTSINTFSSVSFLEYDNTNKRLFVTDDGNYRVLMFDLSAGITDGMDASRVLGQINFDTATTDTTGSTFMYPDQISYDPDTNYLYVNDDGNYRVLVFDVATITNGESAINVFGQANLTSGTNGSTAANNFQTPTGIVVNPTTDSLFVLDCAVDRVVRFDIASISDNESAVGVIGQSNFTNTGTGTSTTALSCGWSGLEVNESTNQLFVADDNNHRILLFNLANITPSTLTDGTVSSAYSQTFTGSSSEGTLTWSLASGSVPTGLSFSAGSLTGTPTTAGAYTFALGLSDDLGTEGTFYDLQSYTLTIAAGGSPTPTPTPSPSSSTTFGPTSQPSNNSKPTFCSDAVPVGAPRLFNVSTSDTQTTLFIVPVLSADTYAIMYGRGGNREEHSMMLPWVNPTGMIFATIRFLQPNTSYWFEVMPIKGCATGARSNRIEIKTAKGKSVFSTGVTSVKKAISNTTTSIQRTVEPVQPPERDIVTPSSKPRLSNVVPVPTNGIQSQFISFIEQVKTSVLNFFKR